MPSSGAGGPCCHCGRTNSCCWRRGPANKPVLCNACGSRYLVKRNLDNYVPLATRQERAIAAKDGADRHALPGRVRKPKRATHKQADIETWSSEQDDSEVSATACIADGFQARQCAADERTGCSRSAALASKLKLRYITSQAQLQELHSDELSTLTASLFAGNTHRLKPRKPVVVTVSAVW